MDAPALPDALLDRRPDPSSDGSPGRRSPAGRTRWLSAFLAVAAAPIRHGNEVKSYATDLLAAVVLLLIAVEWLRGRRSSRGLWLLALATPIALAASLPAVFVAAGIGLVLLVPAWRTGRAGVRAALARVRGRRGVELPGAAPRPPPDGAERGARGIDI